MKLCNCVICGSPAEVYEYPETGGGIGDIQCSNSDCRKRLQDIRYLSPTLRNKLEFYNFHYSGKFMVSKREAMRKWNEMNKAGN